MPKIADIWKLGALGTPTSPDEPLTSSWAHRLQRSLVALERVLRLLHLRVERATFAPDEVRRYATDDYSVKNDTTLAVVPGLYFDVAAKTTYIFRACLFYAALAGGTQYTISGTCTASLVRWISRNSEDSGPGFLENTQHAALGDPASETTGASGDIEMFGLLVVDVAGTLEVQFAQQLVDAGESTVLAGSWFEIHEAANPLST